MAELLEQEALSAFLVQSWHCILQIRFDNMSDRVSFTSLNDIQSGV